MTNQMMMILVHLEPFSKNCLGLVLGITLVFHLVNNILNSVEMYMLDD